jgi:hypothetical protein
MNKSKKIKWCLIISLSVILSISFLLFYSNTANVSLYTRISFYLNHNKNLHLSTIEYELVQKRSTNTFESFYEIRLKNQDEVNLLEASFQSNTNINKYTSVLTDNYSLEIFNTYYGSVKKFVFFYRELPDKSHLSSNISANLG